KLPTPSWVFLLQFRREPKPGDLIEIFHIGYEHWAIYVGDGYVIHLVPPGDLGTRSTIVCSIPSSKAVVKQELLKDVVGNCFYRINNHLDHEYRPEPVNKIIRSAKEKIGERMEYSLLENNCEHFVTNLRYGWPHSKQVVGKSLGQPSTMTGLLRRAHRQGIFSRSTGLCNSSRICL
uniref:LRAT domain-containing protein n=1 Tax=Suricata suricatta TaxID=37032 RepID=A0A673VC41_SURSU